MENSATKFNVGDLTDIESQNQTQPVRDQEGEDTITSMTNQVFIKQIKKLKSVSGSKTSVNSASPKTNSKLVHRSVSSQSTESVPQFVKLFEKTSNDECSDSLTGFIIENQPLIGPPSSALKEDEERIEV